jgi:excisionase family DNA binding protein
MFENLMTVKEVAALLRVSPQTLYKMLEQGHIPAVKIGSQWRFDRERIRVWLNDQTGATAVPAGGKPTNGADKPANGAE